MAAQDRILYGAVNAAPYVTGTRVSASGVALSGTCAVLGYQVVTQGAGNFAVFDAANNTDATKTRHVAAALPAAGTFVQMAGTSGSKLQVFASHLYIDMPAGGVVIVYHLPQ